MDGEKREECTAARIREAVAPCALLCHTCFGYREGAVRHHAARLLELYRGWYGGHKLGYGEHPTAEQAKKLEEIRVFQKTLRTMAEAPDCPGCRQIEGGHRACIPGCVVPGCIREHGVDFCGECPEFPCAKNDGVFAPNVMKKWLEGNTYIREHGAAAYFEANRRVAHYIEFELEPEEEADGAQ